jgi:hypothetical protein
MSSVSSFPSSSPSHRWSEACKAAPRYNSRLIHSAQTHVVGYYASEFVVGIRCSCPFVLYYRRIVISREHRIPYKMCGAHPQPCFSSPSGRKPQNTVHLRISARIDCRLLIYTVLRQYPCTTPLEVEERDTFCQLCIDGIVATVRTGENTELCALVSVERFLILSSSDLPVALASHLTSSLPFGTSVLWVSHGRLLQTELCNLLSIVVRTLTHCKLLLEPIPGPWTSPCESHPLVEIWYRWAPTRYVRIMS